MNEIKKITIKTLPKIRKIFKDNDSYGSGEINSIKLIDNKIEIDFGYNNIAHNLILYIHI